VHLVGKSTHVGDSIILPVTAFGFGNAVLREDAADRNGTQPSVEDPFGAEAIWLLRDGAVPRPFNLDTLVIWTLLLGLLNQDGEQVKPEIAEICQMLREDLIGEERWFLPLKGRLARR
jgi:hypothetical protein